MTRMLFLLPVFALVLSAQPADSGRLGPRAGLSGIQRTLDLPEAIELALHNNLDIEIERLEIGLAEEAVQSSRGAFDTTLSWLPGIRDRRSPTSSVLQGGPAGLIKESFMTQNFAVRKKLAATGGELSFDFDNSRQSTSNLFVNLNPFVQSQMFLSFTQPLIRNRKTDRDRTQVAIRQRTVTLSKQAFELRVIDVLTAVQRAYWDLVFARRDLEVREEAVQLAGRQFEMNRRMAAAGTLAEVEIVAAEAELERRRGDFFAARDLVTQAENRLKTLVCANRSCDWWPLEIVPAAGDAPLPPLNPLPEAVQSALRARPESHSVESQLEINGLNRDFQKGQTKPRVDLVAGYGQIGLAGALRTEDNPFSSLNQPLYDRVNRLSETQGLPAVEQPSFGALPSFLRGGYGQTLSNLFDPSFRIVQVGVEFELTPRNRTAEAELARTLIERRQLEARQNQLEQAIEAEVRNAFQALETAQQQLSSARSAVRARREKLESETRLFENGESTNFLVLTRQNEYSEARATEVRTRANLNLAIADYQRALGTTLKTWGITLP